MSFSPNFTKSRVLTLIFPLLYGDGEVHIKKPPAKPIARGFEKKHTFSSYEISLGG